jgi:hypothetical protein
MEQQRINDGRIHDVGRTWDEIQPQLADVVSLPACIPVAAVPFSWAWMYQFAYVQAQESVRRELWLRQLQPGMN